MKSIQTKVMSMIENDLKYSIQQVSDMTGVSKQLIRKWEDRYDLVHPQRLDNGYRMYSLNEVNIIKAVTKLIEQGNSVKQAASIIQSETFDLNEFLQEESPKENIIFSFKSAFEYHVQCLFSLSFHVYHKVFYLLQDLFLF